MATTTANNARDNQRYIDLFVDSYKACAIFADAPDDCERTDILMLMSPEQLKEIVDWYKANVDDLFVEGVKLSADVSGMTYNEGVAAHAGHDLWLTRQGHGSGFWDGDYPEPHAARLSASASALGEVCLYVDEDAGTAQYD